MSVENTEIIDVISVDKKENVVLTISDHLEWDDENNHLLVLQNKINRYLISIEGGSLYESYPKAKGRSILIQLVAKFYPNREGITFLSGLKDVIESAGYKFEFKHQPE